jgi:hypothetical protein
MEYRSDDGEHHHECSWTIQRDGDGVEWLHSECESSGDTRLQCSDGEYIREFCDRLQQQRGGTGGGRGSELFVEYRSDDGEH